MRNLTTLLLFLLLSISVRAAGVADDKPIHVLTIGGHSFTNVVFEQVTDTHVFFQHAGGMSSVRLADLDPKLQKQLGYDPVKGAALLQQQAQAQAYAADSSISHGKTGGANANSSTTGTNDSKPQYGTVTKEFLMGKTEKLKLTFPSQWLFDCQPSADPVSPGVVLRFGPLSGSNFVVIVSTLSLSNKLAQIGSLGLMNVVSTECAARAVDKPVVQHLVAGEITGDYFSFADKAYVNKEPKPGAYRYQMQGMANMKDFYLYFTALFNYQEGGEDTETLEMIRTAQFLNEENP